MNESFLSFFDVNTDAVYTNRGFFFQYLEVLRTWVTNYISGTEIVTYTEVDNDIKEVGDTLYFKQVKCFSKKLTFSSAELRKSIFDFFILYTRFGTQYPDQRFCFSTNTAPGKREKLLHSWISDSDLKDKQLEGLAIKKIREVILDEFKFRKNKKLATSKDIKIKTDLTAMTKEMDAFVASEVFKEFVFKLDWDFRSQDTDIAVENIQVQILELLNHKKFLGKPVTLLMSVLLSEIYKCSQYTDPHQRGLTNKKIDTILEQTEHELQKLVDRKFSALLNLELQFLKNKISSIHFTLQQHDDDISKLKASHNDRQIFIRNLTHIPEFGFHSFIGRKGDLQEISRRLRDNRILSVQGTGGTGKSSLIMRYVEDLAEKDHLIWITVDDSLINTFVLNDVLLENLSLKFSDESAQKRLDLIINKINSIQGDNLIVIDLQSSTEGIKMLQGIRWPTIIITRQPLESIPFIRLNLPSFEDAKGVFKSHCARIVPNDAVMHAFFDYVNYNTLVIELTARTIEASHDFNLEVFLEKLTSQNLNDPQLEVDIYKGYDENAIRMFSFLQQTFDVQGLDSPERGYLEFLALLPSTNIVVEELIALCGQESYATNKVTIPNYLSKLNRKGWIELSPDKKHVSMHRMIQEMIIYKERSTNSPFVVNMFYLSWLRARLKEGTDNPSKSFAYIKYAESILSAIKEPYRSSVNHHLLLLENEVLYTYGYYYRPKEQLSRWIDLYNRTEIFLPPDDLNRSVIASNLGLSYNDNNDIESAVLYFNKAITALKKNLPETAQMSIVYQNNLCQAYLENGQLQIAFEIFAKTQKMRKKYNLWDDVQLSLEYSFLARSYYICHDVVQSIKFINEGISKHKTFPKEKRNDFYLSSYNDTLAFYHLENNEIHKAIVRQKIAINILESMKLGKTLRAKQLYSKLFYLYKYSKNELKAGFIQTKLEKFTDQIVTDEKK